MLLLIYHPEDPYPDFYKLIYNNIPTYILGDINASHTWFSNNNNNTVGRSLAQLINTGNLINLGPHYPTYIGQTATSQDKILANKVYFLNIQ